MTLNAWVKPRKLIVSEPLLPTDVPVACFVGTVLPCAGLTVLWETRNLSAFRHKVPACSTGLRVVWQLKMPLHVPKCPHEAACFPASDHSSKLLPLKGLCSGVHSDYISKTSITLVLKVQMVPSWGRARGN